MYHINPKLGLVINHVSLIGMSDSFDSDLFL